MLSMSDSASARMGLSKVQVRAARLDEAGGGGKGAARARPTAKPGLEKKEAALSSGPSLGRKRPRRAYAIDHIAPQQYICAAQHCQALNRFFLTEWSGSGERGRNQVGDVDNTAYFPWRRRNAKSQLTPVMASEGVKRHPTDNGRRPPCPASIRAAAEMASRSR